MSDRKSKNQISITAYWGNDDAVSKISLAPEQWDLIQSGGVHIGHSMYWYEGESEEVTWSFEDGLVTLDREDGGQCLVDFPISELHVEE